MEGGPVRLKHLTEEDRITIWHEHSKGASYTAIAKKVNKHRTSISRDLRRNSLEHGDYVPTEAHQRAQQRRSEASSQPRPETAQRFHEFADQLRQRRWKYSPQQHHGRFTQVLGKPSLSPSWIYVLRWCRRAPMIAWGLINMLLPYRQWVQTITVDNGLEFAAHTLAAQHLQAQFYFCKPYHS